MALHKVQIFGRNSVTEKEDYIDITDHKLAVDIGNDLGTIRADIATVKADIALVKASVSNSGSVYCKTDTAASDAARRFETAEKKIMNASIQVTTNSQLFGQVDGILYQIDPGDTKSLGNIDISTLYFKNATAGQNGTVTILGVEE